MKVTVTVLSGGLFTVFVLGVAVFLQLLLIGTSPKMASCSDFPPQLRSMATTLFVEAAFLALALLVLLKHVFACTGRMARVYTGLFTAACCLSAVAFL